MGRYYRRGRYGYGYGYGYGHRPSGILEVIIYLFGIIVIYAFKYAWVSWNDMAIRNGAKPGFVTSTLSFFMTLGALWLLFLVYGMIL